jgi:peroxidase
MSLRKKHTSRARLTLEQFEVRQLMAIDTSTALQNPVEPCDVNDDGDVSPADVLMVIDRVNRAQNSATDSAGFVDVNGDGNVTPGDLLTVIDQVNRRSAGKPRGPQNPSSPPTDPPTDPIALPPQSFDGTGNNAANPDWGTPGSNFLRKAEVDYADGISSPSGEDRPSPRAISNAVAAETEETLNERQLTAMIYAWGQFLDHDIDLTNSASPAESFNISVPTGDLYFDPSSTGSKLIPLSRSQYDPATGTDADNPRQQFNSITAFIDGSQIYGSDADRAAALRTFEGGRLKTGDENLLPTDADLYPNDDLSDDVMFQAGDIRVNENVELSSMQTLFMREHNRLADKIAAENPNLTDEEIYQRARSIVIAELQAITYQEFIPALLGADALRPYTGYKADVNPGIANEFATAAFRVGHTLLGSDVEFLDNHGNPVHDEVALRDAFFNPNLLRETGIDPVLNYLASTEAHEVDTKLVDEVRNFLFGPPGAGGFDLASLNIQRGRDHGLADYNTTRAAYGLPRVTSFAEITSDPELQAKLEELYGSVDNIDLWVGGLAEDHVPGASVGPLFRQIMVDQFTRLRDGDRYWFENVLHGEQLAKAKHTTLAEVIRNNTTSENLQPNVFFQESAIVFESAPRKGADIVVAISPETITLTDRRTRQPIESRATGEVSRLILTGADEQPDRIMIDLRPGATLPPAEVDGGAGKGNMLVLKTPPETATIVITRRTIEIDGQTIDFSRFGMLQLQTAPATKVVLAPNAGVDVVVNGRKLGAENPPAQPPQGPPSTPGGPTNNKPPQAFDPNGNPSDPKPTATPPAQGATTPPSTPESTNLPTKQRPEGPTGQTDTTPAKRPQPGRTRPEDPATQTGARDAVFAKLGAKQPG